MTREVDYEEIPVFEKDIEEILYANKKVKHFIQKYQYHGLKPDFGDAVIPGEILFKADCDDRHNLLAKRASCIVFAFNDSPLYTQI